MICFPLDNTQYGAEDIGAYLATRTRGVFSAESNLCVTAGTGMTVSISPGLAWLKRSEFWGTAVLQQQAQTLTLSAADGSLSRIDAIVCRLDKVENMAELMVKKGAYAASPTVVDPVRDDNYDEIYLATVSITAGTTAVTSAMVTDQRLNESYCGLMRDGVTGVPTAQLQAQAQELLDQLEALIQSTLDGSAQMLKAVYDPQGKNSDVFAAASGTASGMVSLSDAADSTSGASDGVAATPAAVKAAKDAAGAAQTAADNAQTTADAAMPKAGGQFTGNATAYNTNTTTARLRNAIVQNSSGTAQSTNYIKFVRK